MSESGIKIIGADKHHKTLDECADLLTFIETAEFPHGCSRDDDSYDEWDSGRRLLLRMIRDALGTACEELAQAEKQDQVQAPPGSEQQGRSH